jgi:hypothetical protein
MLRWRTRRDRRDQSGLPDCAPLRWSFDGFVLVESIVGAGGSRYVVAAAFPDTPWRGRDTPADDPA